MWLKYLNFNLLAMVEAVVNVKYYHVFYSLEKKYQSLFYYRNTPLKIIFKSQEILCIKFSKVLMKYIWFKPLI